MVCLYDQLSELERSVTENKCPSGSTLAECSKVAFEIADHLERRRSHTVQGFLQFYILDPLGIPISSHGSPNHHCTWVAPELYNRVKWRELMHIDLVVRLVLLQKKKRCVSPCA